MKGVVKLIFQLNTVSFPQQLCPFRNAFVDCSFLRGRNVLNRCSLFVKIVLGLFLFFLHHFEIVKKKYLKEMELGNVNPNTKRSRKRQNKIHLDKKAHQLAKKAGRAIKNEDNRNA